MHGPYTESCEFPDFHFQSHRLHLLGSHLPSQKVPFGKWIGAAAARTYQTSIYNLRLIPCIQTPISSSILQFNRGFVPFSGALGPRASAVGLAVSHGSSEVVAIVDIRGHPSPICFCFSSTLPILYTLQLYLLHFHQSRAYPPII